MGRKRAKECRKAAERGRSEGSGEAAVRKKKKGG